MIRCQFSGVKRCGKALRVVWTPGFLLGLFCIGAAFCSSGCMTLNPATGRQEIVLLNTPSEVTLGQEIHGSIQKSEQLSADQDAQKRLLAIAQRLVEVSDRKDYQYHFYLIDKNEMNAFTTPGGHVYFYAGLFRALPGDDEVAAVLAHEIGHCAARHVAKKFQVSLGYDIVSRLVFGSMQNELAAQITRMGADALMNIATSAYSREDEYQADRLAVKYMHLAGFDPLGIITTFEVLGQASKGDDGDWLLLRSHPRLGDRIDAVRKEIEVVKTKY